MFIKIVAGGACDATVVKCSTSGIRQPPRSPIGPNRAYHIHPPIARIASQLLQFINVDTFACAHDVCVCARMCVCV